jgi:hypothetical protein
MNKPILTVIFTLTCLLLFSQDPFYKHYNVDNGLPSNEVYHAIQDSKGYIWFATDNGVSRYNGYEFKNYSEKEGLAGNVIFYMYEDYKQRIWFVSYSKQLSYFENDSIYHYKYNYLIDNNLRNDNIFLTTSFYVDSTEKVWFGTYSQGIFCIDKNGIIANDYDSLKIQIRQIGNQTLTGTNSFSMRLYFESYKNADMPKLGIVYYNDSIKKNISFDEEVVFAPHWYSMLLQEDQILLSSGKELILIKDSILSRKTFDFVIPWVGKDRNSDFWLSKVNGGVSQYKKCNLNNEPINYLNEKSVLSVFVDKDKAVWITTRDGVYYYSSIYIKHIGSKDMPNKKVSSLERGNKNDIWWIESGSDISCMANGHINTFNSKKCKDSYLQGLNYYPDKDRMLFFGNLIFGYIEKGKYNKLTDFKYVHRTDTHKTISCRQSVQINDTLSWYVHPLGQINILSKVLYPQAFGKRLYDEKHLCIKQIEHHAVYLGTLKGLWKSKQGTEEFLGLDNSLLKNRIDEVELDEEGNLWIASKGIGVIFHNQDTTYLISMDNGLSSNAVSSLSIDDNIVWAGAMNGLNKIYVEDKSKAKYTIENLYKYHGLASNVVNDVLVVDDTVFVGTDNGFCYFNKKDIVLNTNEVPVYFTNISISERDTLVQDLYSLQHSQNTINIEFIGLNYRIPGEIKYKYRMLGVEEKWIETTGQMARYPLLQPGKYQFELLAMNENGKWNKEAIAIEFIIAKPYWQTWWFYSLLIFIPLLIVSSILFLFYEMRLKESKKRNHLRNNLNKLKQEALAQQMNPHFIFNTLSSIQYYINENDKDASNKYLTKFSRLMRMTLNNTYQKDISLQEEIDALEIYIELEQLRFDGSFRYSINQIDDINPSQYRVPALLLQPFVENAIWHGIMHKEGKSGEIQITVAKREDYLLCKIKDNGIGREKSAEINRQKKKTHKSLGVKITESRLKLINLYFGGKLQINYKDLKDRNGNAKGTEVCIHLPIIQ